MMTNTEKFNNLVKHLEWKVDEIYYFDIDIDEYLDELEDGKDKCYTVEVYIKCNQHFALGYNEDVYLKETFFIEHDANPWDMVDELQDKLEELKKEKDEWNSLTTDEQWNMLLN